MGTKQELENALKEAMKARDETRRSTVRMALSAIKLAEVEKRGPLDDSEVLAILQKEVKTRRETQEEARRAARPDLVTEAEAEIAVLEKFLPRPLSAEELRSIVHAAIEEVGASTPAEMGNVMKVLMPQVRGRADGAVVSGLVREMLGN
jgi:uncharacterized protein YqeY